MTNGKISEQGRQERFAQWEQMGVDRVKGYLQSDALRFIGAPAVQELAWEWVHLKEQEAAQKAEKIVMLKPAVYGVGVDLRALWRKIKTWSGRT